MLRERGNALVEYALPMVVIFVMCGAAAAALNLQNAVPVMFAKASARTTESIQNKTFKVDMTTPSNLGQAGVGLEKLNQDFVPVLNQTAPVVVSMEQEHTLGPAPSNRQDGRVNVYADTQIKHCEADSDECVPLKEESPDLAAEDGCEAYGDECGSEKHKLYIPVYLRNGKKYLDDLAGDMSQEEKQDPFLQEGH